MVANQFRTYLACAALLVGCSQSSLRPANGPWSSAAEQANAGRALYEQKCRTEAGERIYRRVEDVEGIVLLKVRPKAWEPEWADPMWPGAAFAREATADEYITSFLGYEEAFGADGKPRPITSAHRGYINTMPKPGVKQFPGFRFVDVIDDKDGKRYRYTGRSDEPWLHDKSWLKGYAKFYLDRTEAPTSIPRYGVTFEDHVLPEERALGVASSTVKVLDLQTKEVMGEMIRFAWSSGPSQANASPWLTARRCPDHAEGTGAATRKFVDQVLIPIREK